MARPRVIISTDLWEGGEEHDDAQSLIHALLCQDRMDIVGLISTCSKWNNRQRVKDFTQVMLAYERDWPKLKGKPGFKSPDELRAMMRQGATKVGAPSDSRGTPGADLIVEEAKKGLVYLLTWGGETDAAQAVFELPPAHYKNLRILTITGQDTAATKWLEQNAKGKVWWLDNRGSFRGIYNSANRPSSLPRSDIIKGWHTGNAKGHGTLGDLFYKYSLDIFNYAGVKMGDSPTTLYMIGATDHDDPTKGGWGGTYKKTVALHWTCSPDPVKGQESIRRHRKAWLADFAKRFDWCKGTGEVTPPIDPDKKSVVKILAASDIYKGEGAKIRVKLDWEIVAASVLIEADKAKGESQEVVLHVDRADPATDHTVSVSFLNDAWGGSAAAGDRNLHIIRVSLDGKEHAKQDQHVKQNRQVNYEFPPLHATALFEDAADEDEPSSSPESEEQPAEAV